MSPELLVCGNIAKDIINSHESYGGSAAVIAINAKRLGISSGILSVIGQDSFSQKYWQYLMENGIDSELISRCLTRLPECIVSLHDDNSPSIEWVDYGCHEVMETLTANPSLISRYQIIHLVSCPSKLARKLAEISDQLSYEPGPYLHSSFDYLDPVVVDKSKIIFFNEEELKSALTISGFKFAEDFVAGSNRVLVVTRGENGSDLYFQNEGGHQTHLHIDAVPPKGEVIDCTGAGDCYKAGFLSAYLWGKLLLECAQIGSRLGAACTSQVGGILPKSEFTGNYIY